MPNELKGCPDRVWVLNPTDPVTEWDMSETGNYHTDIEYTRTDSTLLTKLKGLRDEMSRTAAHVNMIGRDKLSLKDSEKYFAEADCIYDCVGDLTALIDAEPEQDVCEWEWSSFNAAWVTKCSGIFLAIDNSLSDNGMKFCPYCGGQIKEVEE